MRTISSRVSSESAWNCRAARLRSGTVVVGMVRIVSSFVDVSMGARRPQLQVDRQAGHRAAAVRGFEARRDKIDRRAGAQTHRQPRNGPNHTPVAERHRADVVFLGRGRRGDHELLGALAYILGTTKDGVRPVEVESGLEHDAVRRLPGADLVIRPPDERARPLPASTERLRGERRRTVAVERLIRVQLFRAFQVGVPGRCTPALPRVGRQPDGVGIELPAGVVEVRAMIVGLAAVEPRTLKLHRAREHPRRHHSERDVRAILPVMGDRGERIVGGGGPVRKGDRPHRRLAHRSEIDGEPQIPAHGPLVQRGELHEELVRVLAIVQRRFPVGLARLEGQRIASSSDGPRLGTEHAAELEPAAAQRAACSGHRPIDEPWTIGARGYPLLLQSGESYGGTPLHDRQHPHDLFMELAALYERPVGRDLGLSVYLAPVGEPAVGPVAFPHRPSAADDPLAPISHHWQDGTHITFGVVTAGVFTRDVKLEASWFNGREPDENRTDFDYAGRRLDSYSGRLTVNPGPRWSFSAWYAYLKSPEGLHPDESLHRF